MRITFTIRQLSKGKGSTFACSRVLAGLPQTAYVEPVAVGDPLPALPIFLDPGTYVPAPLDASYEATWAKCPDALREVVENPSP